MIINEKYISAIYRSIPTPMMAFDLPNKELLFSSGLAERILGYTTEEINQFANNDFEDLIHPDDVKLKNEILDRLKESKDGEVVKSIKRIKDSNGEYMHFQIYDCVIERNDQNIPTKITTVAEDVTREAKMSEKLKEAYKLIDQIRQKNSHDVREPVTVIIGILDMMNPDDFQNSYQRELLGYLGATIKKLDRVIHDINKETSDPS